MRLRAHRAPPRTASISTSSRQGPARQNRSWSGFTAAEMLTVKPTTTTRASSPQAAHGSPTVVVTINYRLGLFGFLSESHLNAEGHPWGNYGILDQQAALRWVQANIAAFGGDPTKVALGGQSAGSPDTTANLISPAAAGLFHRAINQSAPIANFLARFEPLSSAATALHQGNNFAAAANCSSSACLRGLSAERILQLQGTPNANGPYVTGLVCGWNHHTHPAGNCLDYWALQQYAHLGRRDQGRVVLSAKALPSISPVRPRCP